MLEKNLCLILAQKILEKVRSVYVIINYRDKKGQKSIKNNEKTVKVDEN